MVDFTFELCTAVTTIPRLLMARHKARKTNRFTTLNLAQQTGRQTDRQTKRQREGERERERERQTDRGGVKPCRCNIPTHFRKYLETSDH